MYIKLSYKLFGAFFLILAIVAGAMMLSRYIFSQNFRSYIHQMELAQLEGLVPALQDEYRAHGSWMGISSDMQRWQRLLGIGSYKGRLILPPPLDEFPAPKRGPANGKPDFGPPGILLTDDQDRPIIGAPGPKDQGRLVPIEVDGRIVGWLGLEHREPLRAGPPAAILERQSRHLYLLGGVVIGLTALIAFMFSRHLLKPIQRLARGTRELAHRNFKTRIQPTTRDELGQLADNFNAMAQTMENYEKMRRQWLSDISHELRTPLAVLRGEIEALQDGIREPSAGDLTSLHVEILRINKLVEDLHLLSLADSDRISLNREWVSPCHVMESILDSYRTLLAQRRIDINPVLDGMKGVQIKGDADRLGQVFANILDNACKYMNPPGVLDVFAFRDDQYLTIYFEDTGPGVPEDALPRLFDRLYRVENSRSRESGGSGLGLSICRQIIEDHSGRIWAANSSKGGLAIGIELPLQR